MSFTNEQQKFIEEYTLCLKNDCASVFLGSGLSRESGYLGWSDLLKKHASKIGLNVNKENDLITLAQYYINSKKDSTELKKYICKVFSKDDNKKMNKNHLLLSSLPLSSYWTTNYDTLIEQALDFRDLKYNKIVEDVDLRNKDNNNNIWLYKMHGDVNNDNSIVISKQDYENYYDNYEMLISKLKSEICTKTFLFLGYSISDPNVMHILARARKVFDKNKGRQHYAIMLKPRQVLDNGKNNRKYNYETIKQNHQIEDLAEYGIEVILVDKSEEITEILTEIANKVYSKNILISASCEKATEQYEQICAFAENLATWLMTQNYKIFTGYGKNIGQHIVSGAFSGCELRTTDQQKVLRSLPDVVSVSQRVVNNFSSNVFIFPFPYDKSMPEENRKKLYTRLRENMIASTRISIIISGEKYNKSNELVIANGVMEEFEISQKQNNLIIPISISKGAALEVWNILKNTETYQTKDYNDLRDSKNYAEILKIVQRMLINII